MNVPGTPDGAVGSPVVAAVASRAGSVEAMPFPDARRVLFRQNPLAEVICQLRFPTVLAIAAELPSAFQDKVRRSYPLYEHAGPTTTALPKELSPLLAKIVPQLPKEAMTHKFVSVDEARSISLTQDFVAVSENKYRRWEDFRTEVELAERALREVYEPAFFSRVGLRYVNVILREEVGLTGVDWGRLIQPYFAGLLASGELKDQLEEVQSQVLIKLHEVDGGFVRVRSGLAQLESDDRAAYLIDADFYVQGRYTSDHAFESLGVFNGLARNLFRWAITEELETALGPESVG